MRHVALTLLVAMLVALPVVTVSAAGNGATSRPSAGVGLDARVLTNAKVQVNDENVGTVERVMVDPKSGRISHVDIKMTSGQNRTISVPWNQVKVQKDDRGNVVLSLNQQAMESSPAASPKTMDHQKSSDRSSTNRQTNR